MVGENGGLNVVGGITRGTSARNGRRLDKRYFVGLPNNILCLDWISTDIVSPRVFLYLKLSLPSLLFETTFPMNVSTPVLLSLIFVPFGINRHPDFSVLYQ